MSKREVDLEEASRAMFESPRGSVRITEAEFKEAVRRLFVGSSRPRSRERDPDAGADAGATAELDRLDREAP